jgi:hypothetical protein
MPTPLQKMMTLASDNTSDQELDGHLIVMDQCFKILATVPESFLLSLRSATQVFTAIEDDLLDALLWRPLETSSLYSLNDDDLFHLGASTITMAGSMVGIDYDTLQNVGHDASNPLGTNNLIETATEALLSVSSSTAGLTQLWTDSLLGTPKKAIFLLSLESDNYILLLGENQQGQPIALVVGTQPFEFPLHQRDIPKEAIIPDIVRLEGDGVFLTGLDRPNATWWDALAGTYEGSLLRGGFIQLGMGKTPDITQLDKPAQWATLPLINEGG